MKVEKIICNQIDHSALTFSLHIICVTYASNAVKDTHREKVQSNKTPALSKSTNMDIWVVESTFYKRFLNQNKFPKK